MTAPSLTSKAGYWTWDATRGDFPFGAFLDKLIQHKHNFTALASFATGPPGIYSQRQADLIAHRVQRLNRAAATIPIVYVWNAWFDPAAGRQVPAWDQGWVDRLVETTKGLDLIWSPCLEPKGEEAWFLCKKTLDRLRDTDNGYIAHNSNHFYLEGADYYEAGVPKQAERPRQVNYLNGDHHHGQAGYGDWLGEYDEARQVEMIQNHPAEQGLLMVTKMRLEGKTYGLEGWPGRVADWDNELSWQATGQRTGQPAQPPEPRPKDCEALARAEHDLWWTRELIAYPPWGPEGSAISLKTWKQLTEEEQDRLIKKTRQAEQERRRLG